MSLTVRVLPTDEPTIEVRYEGKYPVTVELSRDEAEDVREQLHQAIYVTGWSCAHPPCRNHATREDGYCGRCGA